jgi:hypothetical protein
MAPDKVYRAQEIRVVDFLTSGGLDSENEKVQSDAKDHPVLETEPLSSLKRGETLKELSSVDDKPHASAPIIISPRDSVSECVERVIDRVIVDVEAIVGKDNQASPVPEDIPDDLISFGNDGLDICISESLGYQVMSPMGSKIPDGISDDSVSSSASDLLSPSDTESMCSSSSRSEMQVKEMVVVRDMGTQTDMYL